MERERYSRAFGHGGPASVMTVTEPIVIVVDDDASFLRSTCRLIQNAGFRTITFASAEDFLHSTLPDAPACLVLEVHLPGSSGLDLQRHLERAGISIPIVFMTGHGDIPMSVQAMKAGAVEFLTKPFHERDLLGAITQALERSFVARAEQTKLTELRGLYDSLTPREREVMTHVVLGSPNKQIASELGTTEKTIKFHRGHVMHKMLTGSLPELVRASIILGIHT
jgi:FixJ family two-component response regulator